MASVMESHEHGEEGDIREFVIKEEGEDVAVVEVNVDIGGEEVSAPDVNDLCRFCSRVLRVNGIIGNSGLIFTRTKLQQKSLSDRLAALGLELKPNDQRSKRVCHRCTHVVDRLERDLAIFRKWKEDECKVSGNSTESTATPPVKSTSVERDRSPSPKTPKPLKKIRNPPSSLPRRSVTQVITTYPSQTVVRVAAESEAGIIQHIVNQNWKTAANLLATNKELFDELKGNILITINEQCQNLANPNNGFMLWKTSVDDLKYFSFHNLILDLEHMSPFLLSIFNTISNNNMEAACAALCIALRGRENRMSAFAYHINSIIARGGIKKAVFNRLSKMAITTSYTHAVVKQRETVASEGAASTEAQPEEEKDSLTDTEELMPADMDTVTWSPTLVQELSS